MEGKLKILHLEDSVSDTKLVDRVLKKGNFDFEILLVHTKETFVAALDEFIPDLILSDHSLPSFNLHGAPAKNTFHPDHIECIRGVCGECN